jgi:hypothetical protein
MVAIHAFCHCLEWLEWYRDTNKEAVVARQKTGITSTYGYKSWSSGDIAPSKWDHEGRDLDGEHRRW